MALEAYRRKRDFKNTPEPAPGRVAKRAQKLAYVIQKHDATRLHYDFRLELDGVLLSWAVTRGPSTNPADKRLAVRTEDHPLSYGNFEGTIPKGQYGGGTVEIWDKGTWEPRADPHAGLKKGHLAFTLHGDRLTGDWDLIRMRTEEKRENWLLIKARDNAASSGDLMLNGVKITHPDRVISETGPITKGELAQYYDTVATRMLKQIARHPLSLLRCPSGIGKQCFYQRNPGKGLGEGVRPFKFRHGGKQFEYLYIEDAAGLLSLIQMGAIELHPWGASIDSIDSPDRMIFDLDPAPELPFEAVKLAAQDLRQRLKKLGFDPVLKCTGGKGLHITAPLPGTEKWPEVKAQAAEIAQDMVKTAPEAYVATMSKAKRTGKIFIDYFRNDYTATAIADYSVRARPGAPVALPIEWKELARLKSADQFSIKDVTKRLKR